MIRPFPCGYYYMGYGIIDHPQRLQNPIRKFFPYRRQSCREMTLTSSINPAMFYTHIMVFADVLERILAKAFAVRYFDYFDWQARFHHLLQTIDIAILHGFLLETGKTFFAPKPPAKTQRDGNTKHNDQAVDMVEALAVFANQNNP